MCHCWDQSSRIIDDTRPPLSPGSATDPRFTFIFRWNCAHRVRSSPVRYTCPTHFAVLLEGWFIPASSSSQRSQNPKTKNNCKKIKGGKSFGCRGKQSGRHSRSFEWNRSVVKRSSQSRNLWPYKTGRTATLSRRAKPGAKCNTVK